MEWLIGVAAVVLAGVVLVGLFLGPSKGNAPTPPTRSATPVPAPPPRTASTDKVVFQLPPAGSRLEDRTRLTHTSARRRSRTRP